MELRSFSGPRSLVPGPVVPGVDLLPSGLTPFQVGRHRLRDRSIYLPTWNGAYRRPRHRPDPSGLTSLSMPQHWTGHWDRGSPDPPPPQIPFQVAKHLLRTRQTYQATWNGTDAVAGRGLPHHTNGVTAGRDLKPRSQLTVARSQALQVLRPVTCDLKPVVSHPAPKVALFSLDIILPRRADEGQRTSAPAPRRPATRSTASATAVRMATRSPARSNDPAWTAS